MKFFAVGLSGVVLLALAAGCGPKLAETELGDAEVQWNDMVRGSYSGFRPPRTAPPAIKDRNTPLQQVVPVENLPAIDESAPADPVNTNVFGDAADDPAEVTPVTENAPATAVDTPATLPEATQPVVAEPEIPAQYVEYVVKPGDSLSVIAKKFYKDGRLFNRIYEANRDVIKNPNRLPLGMKLRIPQP